jgi:RHS repeat-associated protein
MKRYTEASLFTRNKSAICTFQKVLICLLLSFSCYSYSYGQSIYPPGSVVPENTSAHIVLDTMFNDSLNHLMVTGGPGPFQTFPNNAVSGYINPGYTGTDPHVWGPMYFQGHTFNITFQGDPNYFMGFPAQPTLLDQTYTLKIYAPGDTNLITPIYLNDSINLKMNMVTPRVDFRIDLTSVLANYVPITGLLTVDSIDTSPFVVGIVDSIVARRARGLSTVIVGGAGISFDSAIYLVDSANFIARGGSYASSLQHNRPMFYRLSLNPGSYLYPGFSSGVIKSTIVVGYNVLYNSGSTIINVGGIIIANPTDPSGIVLPGGGGVVGTGGGGVIIAGGGGIILTGGDCYTPFLPLGVILGNPVTYMWEDCPFINYEIQVLRLYNTDPAAITDPHVITAKVDWTQALDLETNNGQQSIRLTTAEGSGYYVWRIRRIYDTYPNGIGDDRNWDPWTSTGAFVDGATVSVNTSMINAYTFYYDVFDDTLNYIYHRQFVEGETNHGSQLRIGEKTTFANYLLMPVQDQVRAQEADTIVASQTIPDNSGRPLLQTLPAPVGKHGFGYEYNYIQNSAGQVYSADDYDQQSNYLSPGKVKYASKLVKYYSDQNGDRQIPNCDTLPFTRTLNYNDGLNRPREIASPGKYHTMGSGHSVKKYYCAPSTDELIRIFGDEAPSSASVLKTYTIDPNNVLNVSYTDEITGKVLATCLSAPQSALLLDTLVTHPFTVHDTVTAKVPAYYPSRLTETKTYTFAKPTQLDYIYKIAASIYGDTCLHLCASCDYVVNVTASNVDDTDASHIYKRTIIVAPTWDSSVMLNCPSPIYEVSATYALIPIGSGTVPTILLEPGTYVVTASIVLGNTNPLTGKTYITEMDTLMLRSLQNKLNNTGGIVVGGTGGVPPITLTGIKGYLAANDMYGLLYYTGADTSKPFFKFVVGCDTFNLPTERCKRHSCAIVDFAEYMITQLGQYDTDNGVTTFAGITNITSTVDNANLFRVDDNVEFNGVIQHMLDDGYNCDTLWNCWVSTVKWYANQEYANTISFPGSAHADWWQYFMNLASYKFPFTPQAAALLTTFGSSVRKYPYKYFPYDTLSNASAENTFCYLYTGIMGGSLALPFTCSYYTTTWMAAIENFPLHLPTDQFHMYNFYRSIKPSSPGYVGGLITTGTLGGFGSGSVATYAAMEDACYHLCDSRYNAIADQVAQEFMKQGVMVPGYAYLSWYPNPPVDTTDLSRVYCMTSAIISHCKAGCLLTPDPATLVIPPSQVLAYKQSMTYSYDFQVSLTDTTTVCHSSVFSHDTTVLVLRDSLDLSLHKFQDTIWYYVDSTYGIVDGIDSGFALICNTDSNMSQNHAMLDWLNNRYGQLHDSLAAQYISATYNWHFMATPGLSSFGGAGGLCGSAIVPVRGMDPRGFFSFDTLRTRTNICPGSNFAVYRSKPRSAFIHSTLKMQVNVVVGAGGGVLAGDSIVVLETVPATGTIISSNGTVVGSTIHFASGGPLVPGDTLKFKYDILMPNINGTNVIFNGQVARYVSGAVSSACTLTADTTRADTCESVYFNSGAPLNGFPNIALCTSCWTPMHCGACICFHYYQPIPHFTDSVHLYSCEQFVCSTFTNALNEQVSTIKNRHSNHLRNAYQVVCNDPEKINDNFINSFSLNQYQYTLYYYDRAGNLIRTVAPRGVRDTATSRIGPPVHYDVTSYEYNTLGQMLRQTTPDGGMTMFAYDKRGKVRMSQNAHQRSINAVSFTKYDALARVVEVGELPGYSLSGKFPFADTNDLNNQNMPAIGGKYITRTIYSTPCALVLPTYSVAFTGANLQNRISYTVTDKDGDMATPNDQVWDIYSYDPHGNVTTKIQYIANAPDAVEMDYEYDVISNKVRKLSQYKMQGPLGTSTLSEDYLEQQYSYDGDKRLIKASTTYTPGGLLAEEASYSYYLHGPLRRHQVGGNIQGLDYTYTLEGWLKGINHPSQLVAKDPGGDSATFGKDLYGMMLNYYAGDFNRTGSPFNSSTSNPWYLPPGVSPAITGGGDLFNGNITSWEQHLWHQTPLYPDSLFFQGTTGASYRYDQLNRITKNRFWQYTPDLSWHRNTLSNPYDETFSYDKNGNIKKLSRTMEAPPTSVLTNDDLTYVYVPDMVGNSTNKLLTVGDIAGVAYPGDFGTTNYLYDETGQLTNEVSVEEDLQLNITWTPYGKVDHFTRNTFAGALVLSHDYLYDAMGNQVYDKTTTGIGADYKYSIYDGHNTKLALYNKQAASTPLDGMTVMERYVYGGDRLGTIYASNIWTTSGSSHWVFGPSGQKEYELHDHLGNVRTTVSASPGPVLGVVSGNKYYNYYAFGSQQRNRTYEPVSFALGFNGKEKKDDWRGSGNSYNYGMRDFDSRVGRFFRVDPLSRKYPELSTYQFASNTPIRAIDLDGLEAYMVFNRSTGILAVIPDISKYNSKLPNKNVSPADYESNEKGFNQIVVFKDVFTGGHYNVSQKMVINMGNENEVGIPNYNYAILNYNSTNPDHQGWYRLDPMDTKPYNDRLDVNGISDAKGQSRHAFRLHPGRVSWGCVTLLKSDKDDRSFDFKILKDILKNTKAEIVKDEMGTWSWIKNSSVVKYGILQVTGNWPTKVK